MKNKQIKATYKVGDKVWIAESELGGKQFILCEVIASHLGTIDNDDNEPYLDDDYDVKEVKSDVIWDFVNVENLYKTLKEAKIKC